MYDTTLSELYSTSKKSNKWGVLRWVDRIKIKR